MIDLVGLLALGVLALPTYLPAMVSTCGSAAALLHSKATVVYTMTCQKHCSRKDDTP